MVNLAIGLSKIVVEVLVKKVEGAIKEEQELWQIVERDSVFIKDEFEMMKSFLMTADRDHVRNNVARTWVRQVRDLSYDAEDCMDDVLDLEPKRPWWTSPCCRYMLEQRCRPRQKLGRALDEAVDKIKQIKARVEEVNHRNLRYNLINATGSQQAATAMDMDLDLAKVQEGSSRLRSLMDYEASHDRLNVISVWGTGGNLGTLAIIRNAFDNPIVCKLHQRRAWVKLMHPFSPKKFLGDLVAQLLTNSRATCGADVLSKMEAPQVDHAKEVEQLLKGHSYLIVLEDLSSMVELDTIRTYLPDEENGSQVIVSTQRREIARLCIGQPQYVQELSQLSADHCVYAFFKEVRIPSQQNQGGMDVASLSAASNYWYYLPTIFGRDEVRRLSELISSSERRPPNDTRVVTVLGPPNIGKDVAKVCYQLLRGLDTLNNGAESSSSTTTSNRLLTPSFELYGWVNMSNDPFSVRGFSQSLLSVLRPNSPDSTNPVRECSRLLSKHRCLVVINGLLRTEDCSALERAGLIYKHPNTCIVVVTTEESVAKCWTTEAKVYNIKPVAHESSLSGGQQDRLLPTAGSMGGPSSELQAFATSWYHYCLTGRDEELCQLYDMISSSRGHQNNGNGVLTVWASPGVEKITFVGLVAKVYSHYVFTGPPSPFQLFGWVDVSNSDPEISLEGFFSQSLLSYMRPQLSVPVPDFGTDDTRDTIQDCLINLLANNRCLVVIGGLKSVDDCQKLINARLICGHHNSCIILITEDESVAKFWKETSSPYAVCNVKPLKVQQQGQLPTPCSMLDDITRLFRMANSCFPEYSTIIGRHEEVDRLSTMISSPRGQNGTRVIVVSGPPGVGKTAVVEKLYSQFVFHRLATHQQFDLCGWVQVSDPFSLMGFSRSLLSVLRPQLPQSPDPIRDCSNLLKKHRCFVVIDGLQSADNFCELENYGLINGHPNSCVVLITTGKSVTTCMESLKQEQKVHDIFEVKPLDWRSARRLFGQFGQMCQQRERLSTFMWWIDVDFVVDKCCGIPIVIFVVAKYMSRLPDNHQAKQLKADVEDVKFVHELATNKQLEFVGLKGLLAWVDSDLKACPEPLKLLILYMLNFSQGKVVVRRKRLVWRWIAEGYIKNSGICDMVNQANKLLQKLEDLTMMMTQVPPGRDSSTRHRGYQLSGFCVEVLMSGAAGEPLFLPLEVSALTEEKRSLSSTASAGRHLRIDAKWKRDDESVFRSLDVSRLRSLTVSGAFEAYFINDSMKVLRVLDLEDASDVKDSHLKEIPKLLPRLRFLSVRGCPGIKSLPDSIGDLRRLETLDIRGTSVTTLPSSILKLRNLQCLRAGYTMKKRTEPGVLVIPGRRRRRSRLRGLACCSCLTTMPRGINQLTALHTLGIVKVNAEGGEAILEELGHLKQLRKLELCGIDSYNVRGLRHLTDDLDTLSLGFTKDASSSNFDIRGLSSGRSRLKLYGHVGILQVLPDGIWVTDLTLEIDDTSLTEDNLRDIGGLPCLRTLRLHLPTGGGKLKFVANDGFRELKVLEITSVNTRPAVHVEFAPGAVKHLEVLKFVGSLRLEKIPPGGLPSLKEFWTEGHSLRNDINKTLEGHPNKPDIIASRGWASQFRADPENIMLDEIPIVH